MEDDRSSRRHVDVWVCEGRMCTAKGASDLAEKARAFVAAEDEHQRSFVRVLRGGCYGQCDLSPNIVVREHPPGAAPDVEANRLTRTFAANERVYAAVDAAGLERILEGHLHGAPLPEDLTLQAREQTVAPANDVAARIRALRLRKRTERETGGISDPTSGST